MPWLVSCFYITANWSLDYRMFALRELIQNYAQWPDIDFVRVRLILDHLWWEVRNRSGLCPHVGRWATKLQNILYIIRSCQQSRNFVGSKLKPEASVYLCLKYLCHYPYTFKWYSLKHNFATEQIYTTLLLEGLHAAWIMECGVQLNVLLSHCW